MARTRFGRQMQGLLRFFLWAALMGLRVLSRWIPWNMGLALGGGLGAAAYLFLVKERRRTLKHLQLALGQERSPEEQRRIARESFQNLGRTFFEVLNLDRLTRDGLDRLVRVDGEEALKAAAANGRGVLFITAHIGNWELMARAVAMRYPLAVVAAPIYDRRVEKVMIGLRATHGIETLVRSRPGYLKRLIAMLRRGGIVGLLIDQDTKTDGVFVPFFHREAFTPTGAASLAYRTGASVVVGFIIREGRERHRITIDGPLDLSRTDDIERDVLEQTARFTKMIEEQVRATPEQWIWMHRRWRTGTKPRTGSKPKG
ncbi:MAG TPA: lysophospholipid acyltransferase family protein [Nitrospiria bacterium]|nr:lysophospholipid acyltransferase family protein [Nitrospiria bacterium]